MLALASTAWLAHAQIYICKDSAGRTLTSDRPIPECAARAMREMNRNGVVKREIAAPLTAEQKHQLQIEQERQKVQADAAREVQRRDQAMLERFHNEGDIELARQRALADGKDKIRQELARVSALEKQLKDATAEAQRQAGKKTMAAELRMKVEEAKIALDGEQQRVLQRKTELAQVDGLFDDTLKRYRELTGTNQGKR